MDTNLIQKQQTGFTLVELIFVILIIGILAIVAVPRWTATSLGLEFEARRVLNDVRYTQMMSVATGQRYRFTRLSGNSYSIANESGSAIVLPSGGTVLIFTGNVVFGSFANLPNNLIAFNSLGVPYTDTGIPGSQLSTTASIALRSGGATRTIQISPETGYGVLS